MTWDEFCEAPGRVLDRLAREERITIRGGRIELALTRAGLASDKPHKLTVTVSALRDGKEKARILARQAMERGEVVGISRYGYREAMIERVS